MKTKDLRILDRLRRSDTQPDDTERHFTATVFLIGKKELRRVVVSFPSLRKDAVVDVSTAHRVAMEQADSGPLSSIILSGSSIYYVQQEGKRYNVFLVRE